MARTLITGGAGFIGANTARVLLDADHRVFAVDDLSLGRADNLPETVTLRVGDVARPEAWERVVPVEGVVHLAGASSAPMFGGDLAGCFDNNILGFIRTLDYARSCGARRVVYASTSSIYGNAEPPLREDGPIDIPNFYAVSKFCMEQIARMYHLQHGLEVIGLRFMSVYGPREEHKGRYANLVSQFIWEIEAGRSPTVYGDGEQTRDFTNVRDVANAIRLVLEYPGELGHEIFNVGGGTAITVNELVSLLNEMMGTRVVPAHIPNPVKTGYVLQQFADLEHIGNVLGYRPSVSIAEGVREILEARRAACE